MSNELVISTKEFNIEPTKAQQIESIFVPFVSELKPLEKEYSLIVSNTDITKETIKDAKGLRLKLKKIRVDTDKTHKKAKEESLRVGKAIDGVRNIVKHAIVPMEEKLTEIEKHFEIQEQKRITELQESRTLELSGYMEVQEIPSKLGEMEENVYNSFLESSINKYNAIVAAEQKAEEERIEAERIDKLGRERQVSLYKYIQFQDNVKSVEELGLMDEDNFSILVSGLEKKKKDYEDEQEKIRLENERLKKEAEEKEKIRKQELARIEKERIEKAKKEAERKKTR